MGALFSFSGRVGRSAYWWAIVASIALYAGYFIWAANLAPRDQIQVYTSYYSGGTQVYWGSDESKPIYIFFAAAAVVLFFISLTVGARRWHDLSKRGWWSLIGVIPVVGSLYVFIMLGFVSGTDGPNRYDDTRQPGMTPGQTLAAVGQTFQPWSYDGVGTPPPVSLDTRPNRGNE